MTRVVEMTVADMRGMLEDKGQCRRGYFGAGPRIIVHVCQKHIGHDGKHADADGTWTTDPLYEVNL